MALGYMTWLTGWVGVWLAGWVGVCVCVQDGWTGGRVYGLYGWVDGCTAGWMLGML